MRKKGFTIIELLTVMTIITLLIGMLIPALNAVRKYARGVVQRGQFLEMRIGLEMFYADYGEYPDSNGIDLNGEPYSGAMILCEVLLGQDAMGFHPDSRLTNDDMSPSVGELYPPAPGLPVYPPAYVTNLRQRTPYLSGDNIRSTPLELLYSDITVSNPSFPTSFDPNGGAATINDVFRKAERLDTGRTVGLPVLYYRARAGKLNHNVANPDDFENIYDYTDNHLLVELGQPMDQTVVHPLFWDGDPILNNPEGQVFYSMTKNDRAGLPIDTPYNKDSYILISAGWDGLYGTKDDIMNFSK